MSRNSGKAMGKVYCLGYSVLGRANDLFLLRRASSALLSVSDGDHLPAFRTAEELEMVCAAVVDCVADPDVVLDPYGSQVILDPYFRIPYHLPDRCLA